MAQACIDRGYTYLGLSDHSQTAAYANGLSPARVRAQWLEIERLNAHYTHTGINFTIFRGIESDILADGSLDYEPDILAGFDFVVASIHSGFQMNENRATNRLIKAIENPFTRILGHPTGRLLLTREGYPVNHKAVIDACAAYNVSIEINANPHRLDLDWTWIEYALSRNVLLSVNPEAHSIDGINYTFFGVCVGRKGLLPASATLNTRSAAAVSRFFRRKESRDIY
jgi:DNA polymerase (family 10)